MPSSFHSPDFSAWQEARDEEARQAYAADVEATVKAYRESHPEFAWMKDHEVFDLAEGERREADAKEYREHPERFPF